MVSTPAEWSITIIVVNVQAMLSALKSLYGSFLVFAIGLATLACKGWVNVWHDPLLPKSLTLKPFLNPKPQTLNPKSLNHKPPFLNPKPQTPKSLNHKP